jgi:hypothetical protein
VFGDLGYGIWFIVFAWGVGVVGLVININDIIVCDFLVLNLCRFGDGLWVFVCLF